MDINNREDIILLVETFYQQVLADNRLNYFFTTVAKLDFEKHMPKMYDFWESTLLHSGTYAGNILRVHKELDAKSPLRKEHFDVWLSLFIETVDALFQGQHANLAKERASSIAMVMQLRLNDNNGLL